MKNYLLTAAMSAFSLTAFSQTTNGLVAMYSFNNGSANDESAYANHGTVMGGATLTTDRFGNTGKAYLFDGVDDYVIVPSSVHNSLNNMIAFSISAWINPAVVSGGLRSIVTKWNNSTSEQYGLFLNDDDILVAVRTVNNGGVADNSNLTANAWYHVVFTFDKITKEHKVYVNGINTLTQSFAGTVTSAPDVTSLSFGAQANDLNASSPFPNRFFQGKIDDIRIYNRVLNTTEVNDLYNEPDPTATGLNNGVVAHYSFNNGNANDESVYANHGAVNGSTLTTDRFGNANKAYSFNGTGYIQVPHAPQINLDNLTAFSVSAWINPSVVSGGIRSIITKWNGPSNEQYGLFLNNDNILVGVRTVNNSGVSDNSNLSANTWYHVVFTFDKATNEHKVYVDKINTLTQSFGGSVSATSSNTSLSFGAQVNDNNGTSVTPNRFFNGKIDDIVIYNRILSTAEIDSLYNAPNPVNVNLNTGLLAKYSFNAGNANDEIGTVHGTVYGATLTTDRFGNSNSAYQFVNSSSSHIIMPNASSNNFTNADDFSVAFWVLFDNPNPANSNILSHNIPGSWNGYVFFSSSTDGGYCNGAGKFTFYTASGVQQDACADNPIANDYNNWYFVVGAYNGTANQSTLYINGVAQADIGGASGTISNSANLCLGGDPNNPFANYFSGKIDDIRIYDRLLSIVEIDSLYHDPNPFPPTSVPQHHEDEFISVFPNPTSDMLNITVKEPGKLSIYSIEGQLTETRVIDKKSYQIDFSKYAGGFYLIKFYTENGKTYHTRIVKR